MQGSGPWARVVVDVEKAKASKANRRIDKQTFFVGGSPSVLHGPSCEDLYLERHI